jgi:hypothetical protein
MRCAVSRPLAVGTKALDRARILPFCATHFTVWGYSLPEGQGDRSGWENPRHSLSIRGDWLMRLPCTGRFGRLRSEGMLMYKKIAGTMLALIAFFSVGGALAQSSNSVRDRDLPSTRLESAGPATASPQPVDDTSSSGTASTTIGEVASSTAADRGSHSPVVWGLVGVRGYAFGQQVAPNGLEYNPLFTLDANFNA